MPYHHSRHIRETERLICGQAAQSRTRLESEEPATDPLTGFSTLKEFYRLGQPLVETCLSQGVPCAVAIVDIDHFRRLNETCCEETVSQVLKAIATNLAAACDGNRHLLARLDDEEFGLLLIGLDAAAAMDFCENLRLRIAAKRFGSGDREFSVTVSIGLAKICGPEIFDNYLNAAEQFLFMAKSHGRNQVFSELTVILEAAG